MILEICLVNQFKECEFEIRDRDQLDVEYFLNSQVAKSTNQLERKS
jgi:hypothetical protein